MALTKCKECGGQVSTKAKTCPSCGASPKKPLTMVAFIGYAVLGSVLLGVIGSRIERNEASLTPEQRQAKDQARVQRQAGDDKKAAQARAASDEKACSYDMTAYVMSQSFVQERLKAPSTAKFPSIVEDGVKTQYVGDCTHKIVGYVDAQNAFGAQIRTKYYVKLKNDPKKDSWKLLEIKIAQ